MQPPAARPRHRGRSPAGGGTGGSPNPLAGRAGANDQPHRLKVGSAGREAEASGRAGGWAKVSRISGNTWCRSSCQYGHEWVPKVVSRHWWGMAADVRALWNSTFRTWMAASVGASGGLSPGWGIPVPVERDRVV